MLKLLTFCVLCCAGAWAATPLRTAQMLEEGVTPVRVVCFGDSITGIYYHSGNRRAWPEMLKIALTRLYPDADITVINAGVSGNTSAQGLARMQKDVLNHKPHLVVVMFGMNDLAYGAVTEEEDAVRKTAFTNNLGAIVERCRTADAEVMLCTQNPVYADATPSRPPERVGEFARLICQTGQALGIPVADIFTEWNALKTANTSMWRLLMSETIHPSMAGHKRIAERVAERLSERTVSLVDVLPERPVCAEVAARLKAGGSVTVAASETFTPEICDAISARFPAATVTVIEVPSKGQSLDGLVNEHKKIRNLKPDLVFLSLPPHLLTYGDEETYFRQASWIVNWSLPVASAAWTAVGLDPQFADRNLTPQQLRGADLLKEIVRGHDLDWIAHRPSTRITIRKPDTEVSAKNNTGVAFKDALIRWFDEQE